MKWSTFLWGVLVGAVGIFAAGAVIVYFGEERKLAARPNLRVMDGGKGPAPPAAPAPSSPAPEGAPS